MGEEGSVMGWQARPTGRGSQADAPLDGLGTGGGGEEGAAGGGEVFDVSGNAA